MYWYKRFLLIGSILSLISLQSCRQDGGETTRDMKYFDLKGFFRTDSIRLAKANPLINKTVIHNKTSETKKVHIADWGTELSLFTGSDINKPAWKASYSVQSSDDFLIYKAKEPELKTRDIIIKRNGNTIKWILIFNHTKNVLYETEEKLSYFPDSLYIIQKSQRVRLLGTDYYKISGAFN